MRRRIPLVLASAAIVLSGCAWIQRSSVSSPGAVQGNRWSDSPALGQTRRFVAFESFASNLVPGDTNGVTDVFVRDHRNGTTERVSIASDGTQANGASRNAAISDTGRFVAFETDATNLDGTGGDTTTDVVVRDRRLGTTTIVSVDATGAPITDAVRSPSISGDGGVVAFVVHRTVQGFCCIDVGPFVRELGAGVTRQLPEAYGEFVAVGRNALSDDGTRIVYSQLTPIGDVGEFSVVVADTGGAMTQSKLLGGQLTHQSQGIVDHAISGDGATVVVTLAAPGFGVGEVHRFDVATKVGAKILEGLYRRPSLADDGTVLGLLRLDHTGYVVAAGDGSGARVASRDAIGIPAESVGAGDLSGTGRALTFVSPDGDLVPEDTNGHADVFTRTVRGGVVE